MTISFQLDFQVKVAKNDWVMENISIVAEDEFEDREKTVGQMSKMQLWLYFQYRFNQDKALHNLYPKAQCCSTESIKQAQAWST